MRTLLFSALFLGTAYAVAIQRTANPIDPSLAFQAKIHEKLSQPKQWYADGHTEAKSELNSELPTPASATTAGEPAKEPGPGDVLELMNWESGLGENFRSFLSLVKDKHGTRRKEEPMVPVAPQTPFTNSLDHRNMNWGIKRSVIPPKPKKEKTIKGPEETEPVTEENKEMTTQLDTEITNEDFDELFSYYIAKHDTRGSQGLQGYLDNVFQHRSPPAKSKILQQDPGVLHKRSSPKNPSPRHPWTLEADKKPTISIDPGIFNRIAADYKFDQNPTAINTEDSNVGGHLSGAKRFGGSQASFARQTAGGRGKSRIVGGVGRRNVVPCESPVLLDIDNRFSE